MDFVIHIDEISYGHYSGYVTDKLGHLCYGKDTNFMYDGRSVDEVRNVLQERIMDYMDEQAREQAEKAKLTRIVEKFSYEGKA